MYLQEITRSIEKQIKQIHQGQTRGKEEETRREKRNKNRGEGKMGGSVTPSTLSRKLALFYLLPCYKQTWSRMIYYNDFVVFFPPRLLQVCGNNESIHFHH